MNKIIKKQQLSEKVFRFEVEAPLIARSRRAGHFVIVRTGEKGERIPLTIADSNLKTGTITLVVQTIGQSTTKLCALSEGDFITDVVGPLGQATHIEKFGTVVCAGGGVGIAPMLPIIKALKQAGNRVVSVLAGRTKELIILEDEVHQFSDDVIIMTDDGSYGDKGVVTVGIEKVILREKVDKCFAIGPGIMMKFCCLLTKKYDIPTDVSLNTIMVDGTGMCGACRVTVGGKTKFVCVDGPEFDGHQVDWDGMFKRMTAFKAEESQQPGQSNSQQLTAKQRVAIPRVRMPELAPAYRATTRTEEVNIGLTPAMAMREAQRCLSCKKPTCVEGCPVNIDIPGFIKQIEQGEFLEAAKVIKRTSLLPAVCGRVCPQEKQCESRCIHLKMGKEPVAIGYLERFAADYSNSCQEQSNVPSTPLELPLNSPSTPLSKVAVVGSGPAGLSFAGDMAKLGYQVTVFEALHEIGGVLKYGIPEFRLPNRIVDIEIDGLRRLGVTFVTDCVVGKTISIRELEEDDFKGIFVATGAGLPNFMNIPGENSNGVMSSNEYLTRINLMDASNPESDTPIMSARNVMVVGGGNTAMDSCRTAKRLGAENVFIAYRRSEAEMPARIEEVKHAKEEGIEFLTLHNPIEYIADENGKVCQVRLQQMELGEPDESGRRSPVPIEGAIITRDIDMAIVAVGVSPNPIVPKSVEGLALGRKNTIAVNDHMQSNIPTIFAGGDIVRGGATVILAMGDGRRAASAMHEWLNTQTAK